MIKNISLVVLGIVVILLLIFRVQFNIAMNQTQTQTMKTDIWNTSNNQNINLNLLYTYSTGQQLSFSNKLVESVEEAKRVYNTLSPFQTMFSHVFYAGSKAMIIYPVFITQSKIEKVSVTNYSTNKNTKYNTNSSWLDWKF